jgi:hypothetical protein
MFSSHNLRGRERKPARVECAESLFKARKAGVGNRVCSIHDIASPPSQLVQPTHLLKRFIHHKLHPNPTRPKDKIHQKFKHDVPQNPLNFNNLLVYDFSGST